MMVTEKNTRRSFRILPQLFRLRDDALAVQIGTTLAGLVITVMVVHIVTYFIYTITGNPDGLARKIFSFVNLGRDNSFSESLSHGMLFISAVLFLGVSYETRARTPVVLSAFFGFAWFDDSAQYHERFGSLIAKYLKIPSSFGLRSQDFGEILAWGLAAVILVLLAIWAYKGKRHGDRQVFLLIYKPVIFLILCGVMFDMLHIFINVPGSDIIFTVLEDGGEMLSIAAATAVSVAVLRNSQKIYGTSSDYVSTI